MPRASLYRRVWRNSVAFLAAVLAIAAGATGLLEAVERTALPMALEPLRERLPTVFPLHMGFSGVALIATALAVLLRRRPVWHRPVGRLALVCVLVGGVTALPSAAASGADLLARVGFGVQAVVWLAFAALGFARVRARRLALHRTAMLMMAATGFGAVVLRLMLAALAWLGQDPSLWYGAVAWAAWLVPVSAVAASLAVGKRAPPAHKGEAILAAPSR